MTLVAEVDGAVKMAYLKATGYFKACAIGMQHLVDNKFAFRVLGDSKLEKTYEGPEGLIAGDLDDPYHPTVLKFPRTEELTPYWAVSSSAIARIYGDISGKSWDLSSSFPIYSPSNDPQHLPVGDIFGFQGGFFIEATNAQWKGAILRWEPDSGLKDVLRFPGAPLRGADHFGTDGKDMVWTYGEDPNQETQGYNKLTVMTAPYSLDPDVLTKTSKALTSDPKATNIQPFVVGCGYAARYKLRPDIHNGVFIVRLSDGVSWTLAGDPLGYVFAYNRVLGITCEEMFVEVSTNTAGFKIARIRLDSLGPGTPPN